MCEWGGGGGGGQQSCRGHSGPQLGRFGGQQPHLLQGDIGPDALTLDGVRVTDHCCLGHTQVAHLQCS